MCIGLINVFQYFFGLFIATADIRMVFFRKFLVSALDFIQPATGLQVQNSKRLPFLFIHRRHGIGLIVPGGAILFSADVIAKIKRIFKPILPLTTCGAGSQFPGWAMPGDILILVAENLFRRHTIKEVPGFVELPNMGQTKPMVVVRSATIKQTSFWRPEFARFKAVTMSTLPWHWICRSVVQRYFPILRHWIIMVSERGHSKAASKNPLFFDLGKAFIGQQSEKLITLNVDEV